jgi:hypothetical protein
VIILALFISVITAFPQLYFRFNENSVDKGIELLPDSPWSPRVREVLDGHFNFGNVYGKDGKDNPYLFQPLGSMAVAFMGKIFSLNINDTILFSRFVLPFLTTLLIYSFVFLITRDKFAALGSTAIFVLADSVLSYSGLFNMLKGISPTQFLPISVPVNPGMIYIPLFGFLAVFWLYYVKKDWRYGLASVFLLGLNFHNYFYSWTYLYAFGGILFLIFVIKRDWNMAKRVFGIFLLGLIPAIPFFINLYEASFFPTYAEVGMRLGIIQTHTPLFVGFTVVGALCLFLLFFPRENKDKYYFVLALFLTPLITMNQQVITGKLMQSDHYHWYFHRPMR